MHLQSRAFTNKPGHKISQFQFVCSNNSFFFLVLNILLFIVRCFTESASGKSSNFYWFCLFYLQVFTISKQIFVSHLLSGKCL